MVECQDKDLLSRNYCFILMTPTSFTKRAGIFLHSFQQGWGLQKKLISQQILLNIWTNICCYKVALLLLFLFFRQNNFFLQNTETMLINSIMCLLCSTASFCSLLSYQVTASRLLNAHGEINHLVLIFWLRSSLVYLIRRILNQLSFIS